VERLLAHFMRLEKKFVLFFNLYFPIPLFFLKKCIFCIFFLIVLLRLEYNRTKELEFDLTKKLSHCHKLRFYSFISYLWCTPLSTINYAPCKVVFNLDPLSETPKPNQIILTSGFFVLSIGV